MNSINNPLRSTARPASAAPAGTPCRAGALRQLEQLGWKIVRPEAA